MEFFIEDLSPLEKQDRRRFFYIIFLGLIGTLFEIIGVGLIVPFVIIITDIEVLNSNLYIQNFASYFKIDTREQLILISILCLASIYLLKLIYLTFLSWLKFKFSYRLQSKISSKIFKVFLQQPYLYFTNLNSSKLIQETKDEPAVYCSGMVIGKIDMLSEILIILGISILLLTYSFLPALIIFSIIVIIILLYRNIFRKSAIKWSKKKKYFEALAYNILKYVYNSIIEVKIGDKEKIVSNKYKDFTNSLNTNLTKQMFMIEVPRLYLEFIAVCLFLIFILIAFQFYNNFNDILPSVALFAVSAFKILPSINRIVIGIQKINFSKNSLNVINDLLSLEKQNMSNNYNNNFEFKNNIELKNLTFEYKKNQTILNNLNLSFKFGDIIGIRGPSGTGKTTFVNLLLGLLKPKEGEILIDDKTLSENVKGWQKLVSYAPQRTYILDETIKKNICFEENENNIDLDHLENILKLSALEKLVENSKNKIDTMIGENGSQLSGGQIQRIGFARAIYKKPKFIVLDEITSALDSNNEKIILESLKILSNKMTILLISHRDEALKICDRVYELKNGSLQTIKID